jgi:hypothetical protein
MANNNLIKEGDVPSNWEPVESPTPVGGPSAPAPHDAPPLFAGSIAPGLQHDTSFVSTATGSHRIPNFSLMPPAPSANASVNSATKSVATSRTAGGGAGSGSGGSSSPVTITLDIPNIFTPVTQTVPLPGTVTFALANEPQGTVLGSGLSGVIGLDVVFFGAGSNAGAGTATTTGGAPATTPEWALYTGYIQGSHFVAGPAGWTALANTTTQSPQYVIQIPSGTTSLVATQTVAGPGGNNWSTVMAYFSGNIPTFIQNNLGSSGSLATTSVPFTTTPTLGNSALVIVRTTLSGGPLGAVVTDTQGNFGILVGTSSEPNNFVGAGSQTWVFMIQGLSHAADTVNVETSAPSSTEVYIYEIPPLAPLSVPPRFQTLPFTNLQNVFGILGIQNGGTGSDLVTTGGTSQVLMQETVGGNVTVRQLAFADLSGFGKITKYNNIATVSEGVPVEYATVDLTGQLAAIAPTTLYTPTLTGMFRISAYLKVTTVDATSSTLGPVTITYTDGSDSVAQSNVMMMADQTGAAVTSNSGNTTVSILSGSMVIYAFAVTAIQYAVAYASNVPGTMAYEVHLKLEAM